MYMSKVPIFKCTLNVCYPKKGCLSKCNEENVTRYYPTLCVSRKYQFTFLNIDFAINPLTFTPKWS